MAIQGSCDCGAVRIELARAPTRMTDCNCSICHRLGALWAYYSPADVQVTAAAGATGAYQRGDRMLEFLHCVTCGCTTHWQGLDETPKRMGVNVRLIERSALSGVPVVRLDGADTWAVLSEDPFR